MLDEHELYMDIEPLNLNEYYNLLKKNKLIDIKFYQVNAYDYKISDSISVFEGIELILENGFFSIGFNPDQEYNFFKPKPINEYELYEDDEIEQKSNTDYTNLLGKKIVDVKFKLMDFDAILDYTLKKHKISEIVEMILYFDTEETLQIASIDYDYSNDLKNYNYDLAGQLIISMNYIIPFSEKTRAK